jgi:tripartite-type tricarboxylate transporter receptor subunit TctC
MAGLVPAIHVFTAFTAPEAETWFPRTSPGMTEKGGRGTDKWVGDEAVDRPPAMQRRVSAMMKRLLLPLLALAAVPLPGLVRAQPYPQKPITIVVPYPPGATLDLLARLVGQKLKDSLGQPVIVENRTGAGDNIGSTYVAKAAPDGYTIQVGNDATHATNIFLYKEPGYHPVKDFEPITLATQNIIALAVNPAVPSNNVAELIAYAKANPNALSFGSSGTGSPHHLAGELLQEMAGIQMVHVPYRGGGPAVTDLMGNQIPMMFASFAAVAQHRATGKLKVLAVVEAQRYAPIPDVPTIGETVPGFEMTSWLAFFAPAGTPKPIVELLNREMVAALRAEDVRGKMDPIGMAVVASTPEELAAIQARDLEKRGRIIRSTGIQPE